jgi:hypothetical protein
MGHANARGDADRETDSTATWSLTTLQRVLRSVADTLPQVSTYTIWRVPQEAGYRYGKDRTWCHTGIVQRREAATRGWNQNPTPFVWGGKRAQWRRCARERRLHALGGSGACTRWRPIRRRVPTLDQWRCSRQLTW